MKSKVIYYQNDNHRVIVNFKAEAEAITSDEVTRELLKSIIPAEKQENK